VLFDAALPPGRIGEHAPSPEQARGLPPGPRGATTKLY